ncbi:ABC transporter ATP-binding protein [Puniceicoccaceae bacterium K14]|nr:ABC transporter ATP-binding protein [Puniceicoccaceae bacterium K14]
MSAYYPYTYAISTTKLVKQYGLEVALQGLELNIEPGIRYALLGCNGAGKTTTLKILTNILRPTEGEARLLGVETSKMKRDLIERIGFVSESQKLPEWMTVNNLLKYIRPMYRYWDEALTSQLIDTLEIPTHKRIRGFSRGMKLKAKLLSVLPAHPKVLMMDEPMSGLDPLVREDCLKAIQDWSESTEGTLLVSSHDIEDIAPVIDRIGILHKGKLFMEANTEDLQQTHKRLIIERSEITPPNAELPEHWTLVNKNESTLTYIDTQYNSESTESLARSIHANMSSFTVEDMRLKEIYVHYASVLRKRNYATAAA